MRVHVRMSSRDAEEGHRVSTPLELFLDLTFVVAVARAAAGLASGLAGGHATHVLVGFPLVFFAIWWAWMNFTWFASAYDTDDVPYRIAVLVQMTGVLIVAAGVSRAIDHWDFGVVVVGYVVMRLAMVGQWLRAAASHPEGRRCALRYAAGVGVVQVLWVARQALPAGVGLGVFLVLVAGELAVPAWAEAAGRTAWHPSHIAERYGLFTIIVLGETMAGTASGVQAALDAHTGAGRLGTVVAGGLLLVFAMWWMYFDAPAERVVEAIRHEFGERASGAFLWGYGHYVVFAAVAATGAGLSLSVDRLTHHSQLGATATAASVTVPATLYLLAVWALHVRAKPPGWLRDYGPPVTAILVLCSTLTPEPVLVAGLLLVLLVALWVVADPSRTAPPAPSGDRGSAWGDRGPVAEDVTDAQPPDGRGAPS